MMRTLLPRFCMDCDRICHIGLLCQSCFRALPWRTDAYCLRCGNKIQKYLCLTCAYQTNDMDQSFIPFTYATTIKKAIIELKFNHNLIQAQYLASNFYQALCLYHTGEMPDLLIPIPQHINKYRSRGFNPTLLLTKSISQMTHINYSNVLSQTKITAQQSSLSAQKRIDNIRDAFTCDGSLLIGMDSVALIDDVLTTGQTIQSAIKAIKFQCPYIKIHIWVMAKVI